MVFGPYRTINILHLNHKNQSFNIVKSTKYCLKHIYTHNVVILQKFRMLSPVIRKCFAEIQMSNNILFELLTQCSLRMRRMILIIRAGFTARFKSLRNIERLSDYYLTTDRLQTVYKKPTASQDSKI